MRIGVIDIFLGESTFEIQCGNFERFRILQFLRNKQQCMVCEIRDSVRSAIFWGFMQCIEVIPYGRFRKTYRSLLQRSRNLGREQRSLGLLRGRNLNPPIGIKYSQFPEGILTLI
jgi:hypothetical protein